MRVNTYIHVYIQTDRETDRQADPGVTQFNVSFIISVYNCVNVFINSLRLSIRSKSKCCCVAADGSFADLLADGDVTGGQLVRGRRWAGEPGTPRRPGTPHPPGMSGAVRGRVWLPRRIRRPVLYQ